MISTLQKLYTFNHEEVVNFGILYSHDFLNAFVKFRLIASFVVVFATGKFQSQ